MSLYYFTKRNSLFGRVCSYVLTFVLVLSMALGCVVLPQRVSTSVKAATTAKYRNVMYYGDWSIYSGQKNFTPDKIDGSLITHLNFAFMDADANGDLITTDTWADYQNPNVGYSVGSDTCRLLSRRSCMMTSSVARSASVKRMSSSAVRSNCTPTIL